MNICIITPSYPTPEGRGGYFFVEQLVLQFAEKGHRCYVVAPVNLASTIGIKKPYGEYHEQIHSANGTQIDVYRPRFYGRDLSFFGVKWSALLCRRALEHVIQKNHLRIDIIYAHFFRSGVLAWPYATANSVPLFVATGESIIPKLISPCRGFSVEKFRQSLSGVICVSTKNKEEAIGLRYTTEDKCVVIPNGVDLHIFRKLDKKTCRDELGISYDDFVLICVGNFTERKGQTRIVNAVDRLGRKNIKVILAGRGELEIESSNILYKGFVAHGELPVYLNAADAYIIPTRWEGCCNSIIEAMACGLPIISSNRPFNWDVLNKDNSIMIDPDNIDEIAKAILTLYEDESLRERLSKNAYRTAQNLSISRRAQGIVDFMNDKM